MPSVMITGANRGIGLEFARHYRGEGWDVIATARKPEEATDLQAIGGIEVLALDVSDPNAIDNVARSLGGRAIDLLINNAGIYGSKAGDIDRALWHQVFEVNVIAPFMLTRALIPNLKQADEPKAAILSSKMGSMADNTSGGAYIYRSSKAAVNAVFKSFSHDLREAGIAVVILHPGWVRTDMGGPNAMISADQSVLGMQQVIAETRLQNSGRFMAFDGLEIPW